MDYLHAYWRMEYVESPVGQKPREHLFRDLPLEDRDRENGIVARREHTYLLLNRFPYNAGHLLVIPYREVAGLDDLNEDESTDFWEAIREARRILDKALHPDGFNIGLNLGTAAGAGIPHHIHAHVVPRWNGDTNFMPVVGQARVLPTALDTMWERLHSCSRES